MQTEPQASLDCEAPLHVHNNSYTGDDPGLILSYPNDAGSQKPAKRPTRKKTPTRQWAAWTREEEESFFTALRQVGKNFEKITSRVQSKNKDQVRHYYYRLVRRMNKLLGPGFCLDARNSKDTIAAMLRWWSLLEKYSCKASKLHLKPRRFKIFIEALELQLLKDQKKSIKKRPSQENCSPAAPSNVSSQTRASGNDNRAAKPVLVDSQNVQKLGPGKASSLKRNVNIGVNRNNSKGDSSNGKTTRQRRKPAGPVSSAAYKRWEKAAIAGVSLVADAAEHLERTGTDKEVECDQGQKGFDPAANMLSPSLFSQNTCVESNTQSSSKLKLQLFPIDEATRRALEMDKHNPHLELTLSTRKKISSVLDHLNRKWGDSSIASGELMLFPYSVQRENLVPYQRWTQDSIVTASDVYARIGSPAVFRLRYGWISANELRFATHRAHSTACSLSSEHIVNVNIRKEQTDSIPVCAALTDQQYEDLVKSHNDKLPSTAENTSCLQPSTDVADVPDEIRTDGLGLNNSPIESYNPAANMAWLSREAGDGTFVKQVEDSDGLRLCNGTGISAGEWADSLTNVSVGDLLSEVSRVMDASCIDPPVGSSSQCLQPSPFTCDSFDAAIAAHISRHQDKTGFQSDPASYSTSIWDAEETCDAFSFQKNSVIHPEFPDASRIAHPGACEQIPRINSGDHGGLIEEMPEADGPTGDFACEYLTDECHSDPHMLDSAAKDFSGLSDIYWPDSLGPLDLEIPSTRYQSNDMILSDSLSGLNRLIASSLDAFQNCTFFGEEKKETASSVEACESASFSDFKIGSEV